MAKVGHFKDESFRHEPSLIEVVPDEKIVEIQPLGAFMRVERMAWLPAAGIHAVPEVNVSSKSVS